MRAYSPIKSLQGKESRRLNSILEDQAINQILAKEAELCQLQYMEDQIFNLKKKLELSRNEAEVDVHILLNENDKLKFELDAIGLHLQDQKHMAIARQMKSNLINKNLCEETVALTKQNENLKLDLHGKRIEIEDTQRQKTLLNKQYESIKTDLNTKTTQLQNVNKLKNNLNKQNQSLKFQLNNKEAEVQNVTRQKQSLKENYQTQLNFFKKQNADLKKRLLLNEKQQMSEIDKLKKKYASLHIGDTETLKSNHSQQIRYLITQTDKLKNLLNDKTTELQLQFQQRKEIKQRYDNELQNKIKQINQLKNQMLLQEIEKNKEIKQLQNKKQLQRSRAVGIIGNSKQSAQYLQGEIKKLKDQIAQKNLEIENLTRTYFFQKRKNDESTKIFNDKLSHMVKQHEQNIRDKIQEHEKRENLLKQEINALKQKHFNYLNSNQNLDRQLDTMRHQYSLLKIAYETLQIEFKQLKLTLEKQREQHIRELNKMISEKMKRKSSRMLSSRSLNQSNQNIPIQQPHSPILHKNLPVVKQQLRQSKHQDNKSIISGLDKHQEQENEIERLIAHYQTVIQQIKKSCNYQISVSKIQIQTYKTKLHEKTQENLEILKKFSPLVKIHANQKSLDQDRKQRMDRHWKGDISLLSILLDKNRIRMI